jgi:NitT/TauT family transport system substrate-binding protein
MMSLRVARAGIRAVLFVLLVLGVLLGCSGGKSGEGRHKLVLPWVPEPEFGGFYAAQETGAYKRAGLDVEIVPGGPGVPVLQLVSSGQADFGITGGDELVRARSLGVDVIPLFAVYQKFPIGIMAHASRGAKRIADLLESGTLAVEPGNPYVTFLKKKYSFDKVKVIPYDGGVGRFVVEKDHAQQCFVTSEPLVAKSKGADPQVFMVADEGYSPYGNVLFTRGSLWKDHPETVRAMLKAVREGWKVYLDDPGQANAVMAKLNSAMSLDTFRDVAAAQRPLIEDPSARRVGAMTRERWEQLAVQLKDIGLIEKIPPVDDYHVPFDD